MNRRGFIAGLGATAAWPIAGRAQQGERLRRIAALIGGAENDPEQIGRIKALRESLHNLGWVEDRNVKIDVRYTAGDAARTQALAKELIDAKPDVIIAATTAAASALKTNTRISPIVFVVVSDPIGSGLVESLSRPGGNVTGFLNIESSLGGKWIELLREIAPKTTRASLMFNPDSAPQSDYYRVPLESAARSVGIVPEVSLARSDDDIEAAIAGLAQELGSGLIIMPDFWASAHRKQIISQAARYRVPAVYPYSFFAREDGLLSYGVSLADFYRNAARYVNRILKGDNPADLPVQAPTKFELIVNLRTAKALGLDVPPTLLARADEVIE